MAFFTVWVNRDHGGITVLILFITPWFTVFSRWFKTKEQWLKALFWSKKMKQRTNKSTVLLEVTCTRAKFERRRNYVRKKQTQTRRWLPSRTTNASLKSQHGILYNTSQPEETFLTVNHHCNFKALNKLTRLLLTNTAMVAHRCHSKLKKIRKIT